MCRKSCSGFIVLLFAFLLLAFNTNVSATSLSTGQATIDWNSLAISWNDSSISLDDYENSPVVWKMWPDPAGSGQLVQAKGDLSAAHAIVGATSIDDESSADGWGSTDATASLPPVQANGSTSETSLQASSSSAPYFATEEDRARAWASVWRNGFFEVLDVEPGILEVSINYTFSLTRNMDNPDYERLGSDARAVLHIGLWSYEEYDSWEDINEVRNYGASPVFNLSGTLNLLANLSGGAIGYIAGCAATGSGAWDATATTAPIPEPATMLLLASGLAGLAGFRRKFRGN